MGEVTPGRCKRLAGAKRSAAAGTLPYTNRALERAPDRYRFANQIESGVPAGMRKSSMTCPRWLGFASPPAKFHRPYRGSKQLPESSRPGEFHPQSLTESDLTLSRRPALLRLTADMLRFRASVPPIAG